MVRIKAQSLAVLVLITFAAPPLSADWLVTRDGARIETKGGWSVEGRRILFTQPNGTLASIRTDEVDLDRSAVETARIEEAAAEAAVLPVPREPVLRLTEKDHPPVRLSPEDESAPEAEEGSDSVKTGLEVISWDRTDAPSGDGIEILGTIRNSGGSNVTSPSLVVALYDSEGALIATAEGAVNAPAIPTGKTANFRAVFTGVTDFAAAKFDAQGTPFAVRTDREATEAGDIPLEPTGGEPLAPELAPDGGASDPVTLEEPPSYPG